MTSTFPSRRGRPTRRGILAASAIGLSAVGLSAAATRWFGGTRFHSVTDDALAGPLGDVWVGAPDARVRVIEYAALTCSHCAAFHGEAWPLLKGRWIDTGQVRFALRGFSLNALDVAGFMVARANGSRNYYAMTDLLFERQTAWAFVPRPLEAMRVLLGQAGFGRERLDAILNDQALYDGVEIVRARAASVLGVHATPTLFVNSDRHEGAPSDEALDGMVRKALAS